MSSMKPRRPLGAVAYVGIFVAVGVIAAVAGFASGLLEDVAGLAGMGVRTFFSAVTMTAAMGLCIWWWRGIDEAAREAHKWAWWWGGTGGMAAGAVVLLSLKVEEGLAPRLVSFPEGELVAGGMMAILLFQMVGYLIAWAAWWLRHR